MSFNTQSAQCEGKAAYATKAEAIATIARIQKRGRKRSQCHKQKRYSTASLHAYRCQHCHQWHTGNPPMGKGRK